MKSNLWAAMLGLLLLPLVARAAEVPQAPPKLDLFGTPPPANADPLPVAPTVVEPQESTAAWTPALLVRIVRGLADDHYGVRRTAQRELQTLPRSALVPLARLYHATPDFEARTRLEAFARTFFRRHMLADYEFDPRKAFLGIAPSEGVSSDGKPCVAVAYVIEGTAAEQCGIKAEDRIITVDGKPPDADFVVGWFAGNIAARRPGSVAHLTVERQDSRFLVQVRLGAMPRSEEEEQAAKERAMFIESRWFREAFLKGRLDLPDLKRKEGEIQP